MSQLNSNNWFHKVKFSPNGKWVATDYADRSVGIWSVVTGNLYCTLGDYDDWVAAIAWSPDGRLLAVGTYSGSCRILHVKQRKSVRILEHQPKKARGPIHAVAFFPDGKSVVTGGANAIRWDVATGKKMSTLQMKGEDRNLTVFSLACSSDGRRIAVGFNGGEALVWNSVNGETIRTVADVPVQFMSYVAFLDKTKGLITAGGERRLGQVTFWRLDMKSAKVLQSVKLSHTPDVQLSSAGRLSVYENRDRWPNLDQPLIQQIHVWDAHKAKKLVTHRLRNDVLKHAQSLVFSHDARLLAVIEKGRKTIDLTPFN